MTQPWQGRADPRSLTERDFKQAAQRIGCDVPAIKAVWEVEAGGRHFLPDGSVIRRFEPHHFPKRHWDAIGFSVRANEAPWRASLRLSNEAMFQRAAGVDLNAAIDASSWGAPQIMAGMNHRAAGFASGRDMVEHMAISAAHQLGAFVQLVESWGIAGAIRAHDWRAFARRYNGSGQVDRYAALMESAYRKHSGDRSAVVLRVGARGAAVMELQRALGVEDDGAFGPQTLAAVEAFQKRAGLPVDGIVGHRTWTALQMTDAAPEPPNQPDTLDSRASITEKATGGAAAVTAVTAAGASVRDLVPDDAWTIAAYAAIALACLAVAAYLFRWVRS
jgi:hypothetical protein